MSIQETKQTEQLQLQLPDIEPMVIPEISADYVELHKKMREELDPDSVLVSDSELVGIIEAANLVPYRAINRCLIVMEQKARTEAGGYKLIEHVRYLRMKFSDGLLKLNEERFSSRC